MESTEYIEYRLKLIKSCGAAGGHAFGPTLFCTLDVFLKLEPCEADRGDYLISYGNFIKTPVLMFLHRENTAGKWAETVKNLSHPEAVKIYFLLQELGFPDRLPEVDGVIDTSDGATEVSLQIGMNNKQFYLNIYSSSGGFRGPDGRRLEELFQYIFDLAGLENSVGWNRQD